MTTYLIIGNIFSLLSAICIAISVIKKKKKDLIGWQILDILFCLLANVALSAYAAFITNIVSMIRNILAYRKKLTPVITIVLFTFTVLFGWYVNNLGLIGWLAIISSGSYTIFMYIAKNAQQMRYVLILNLSLWFVHDLCILAYPSAITELFLTLWTIIQIFKNASVNQIKSKR